MIEAFSNAGAMFKLTSLADEDMEDKCNTYQKDPANENLDNLESAKEHLLCQKEYQTCEEFGTLQG
eukprot:10284083-Prorocentrum_lima.AAC.1